MRLKANVTLFVISIIWGSAFVAQRVAAQVESVYVFNGLRYVIGALMVVPFARNSLRGRSPLPSSNQIKWTLIAGFFLFAGSAFQQAGIQYTTAGNAGFITSLYVVFIPLILFLVYREKPHWIFMVAVVMAVGGAFLLSTGGKFDGVHLGDVLELLCALFWAFHVIILGKYARKFDAMTFSVGQLLVCGILHFAVGAFVESAPVFDSTYVLAVAYTAVLSVGVGYTLQVWAQRFAPPADAALILGLESVFAVVAGWLLLDERLAPIQIVGCGLIFFAVLLSQFREWTTNALDANRLVEGR
ncbi:MAG: DMT family transporter [Anaerolineales bacterium]|nr:DMT family transporter [Anaerolineales bacterium]